MRRKHGRYWASTKQGVNMFFLLIAACVIAGFVFALVTRDRFTEE
jgi:hypothetical protein